MTYRALSFLGLGLGFVLSACDNAAYETIAQGNTAYESGDYEGADARYQDAGETLADLPPLHYNRANVSFRLGQPERAEELYSLALRTQDPFLGSRVKYNLGRIKHGVAAHNVERYEAAIAPLREAIAFYQGSLALDGTYEDALYNLGLAQRLMDDLERKKAEEERKPRNSQSDYSPRMGQVLDETAPERNPGVDDSETEVQLRPDGGEASQGPQGNTESDTRGETAQGDSDRELSPDEAAAIVEMIRGRARGAQGLRQQWSRLLMPETDDGKDW